MKKGKLIFNLCLLVLTLACLTFGVYSAVKTSFTASGTITFNAYGLELDVKCTISGLKDGATKTLYGTTFLNSANVNNSTRTNYVSSSAILADDTHFNLSASGATMNLGELAFDELSDGVNRIEIKFEFWNYSDYMVKAEGVTTVGAEDKLIYSPGGAAIMNQYTATETDATIDSDYGWFPIYIFTKDGASAISASENSISIAVTVSPEGIRVNRSWLYDTTVVADDAEDDVYNSYGLLYGITSGHVEGYYSYWDEDAQMDFILTPNWKEMINVATTVLGKEMTSIAMDYGDAHDHAHTYLTNIKRIALPAKLTSINKYCFTSGCNVVSPVIIPSGVSGLKDFEAISGAYGSDAAYIIKDGAKYFIDSTGKKILCIATSKEITSCVIDENTRAICGRAFLLCKKLTAIVIPSCVTRIGEVIFYGCDSLDSITIEGATTDNWAYGNDDRVTYETGTKIDLSDPAVIVSYFNPPGNSYTTKYFVKNV